MNNLKTYRERRGITQAELGNKVGLSVAAICQIENGVRDTNGGKWKLMANALECSVDELLGK